MRTRMLVAAVLALGMSISAGVRAEGGLSPSERAPQDVFIIEESAGADGRDHVGVEPLPDRRIAPRPRESGRRVRNLRRDEATRDEPARRERLDELDEALTNSELLEMEVAADKQQLQKMLAILKETELQQIQGFSNGPVLSGNRPEDREENIERYKKKYAEVRHGFVEKSKALSRERRRVVELEGQLHLATAAPSPSSADRPWKDAMQVLDLILKGVETWQRSSSPTPSLAPSPSPSPSPSPDDPPSKDVDRILDLIRKGVETWRASPSPTPAPPTPPSPAPSPSPVDPPLKDAERVLELILKGVENWQRQ